MPYWEDKFRAWAAPPSEAENQRSDRIIREIRAAIDASPTLKAKNARTFPQGSYRNNTNVRRDSDVDVGVICDETFFYDLPDGFHRETFNIEPATYSYAQFKDDVGAALRARFGNPAVTRGNKAWDIKAKLPSGAVDADVAPFFPHRRYARSGTFEVGVELRPDNGIPYQVINWPEQHYQNGVRKNNETGRRFKSMVRILKSLRNEMSDNGVAEAEPVIGFLNECMVWNAPNHLMQQEKFYESVMGVIAHLHNATQSEATCGEWGEVSELKYLFRGSQKWTRQQANDFLLAAWRYVGF